MALRCMNDNILIALDNNEEITPGGVVLPGNLEGNAKTGTVLSVGMGAWEFSKGEYPKPKKFHKVRAKPGDRVLLTNYAGGLELDERAKKSYGLVAGYEEYEGRTFLLVKNREIMAFID